MPTITLRALFVFSVLEHRRRKVLHFNVTDHPTAAWTSQQIVEAFAEHETSRYLLWDREGVYGSDVQSRIASLQIEEILTAPPQPLAESITPSGSSARSAESVWTTSSSLMPDI